jgi:hypothetical protein
MLRCCAALAVLASAAGQAWTHDGGSPLRQNFAAVDLPVLTTSGQHMSLTFSEDPEDTVSMVEEQLLQSPLVASTGQAIVVQTDGCVIALLADPAVAGDTQSWTTPTATWSPMTDPNANSTLLDECEAAGMALGADDTIYFLDGRNKAVHAIKLNVGDFTLAWQWSAALDTATYRLSVMPLDASLLVLGSQLWVPLKFSLLGSDGTAWVLDASTGATVAVAPLPSGGRCAENEDYGNAIVALDNSTLGGLAQLSSSDCGLPLFSQGDYAVQLGPEADAPLISPFGFAMGQHSHPISSGNSLFYFNFQDNVFSGEQRLCCWDTVQSTTCSGWEAPRTGYSGCSAKLPVLSTDEDLGATFRFSWIAGGLLASDSKLFVATSGAVDEDPLARKGWASTLSVFNTSTGDLLATYRTGADLYNSAPLVVTGYDGSIVLLSTAGGDVLAFAATVDGVNAGPLWRSPDLPAIPPEDIPASTYAFLSITPMGTLLATVSAGGANWQQEKAYVSSRSVLLLCEGELARWVGPRCQVSFHLLRSSQPPHSTPLHALAIGTHLHPLHLPHPLLPPPLL